MSIFVPDDQVDAVAETTRLRREQQRRDRELTGQRGAFDRETVLAPSALPETVRGGTRRERMERAFDRPRALPEPERPTAMPPPEPLPAPEPVERPTALITEPERPTALLPAPARPAPERLPAPTPGAAPSPLPFPERPPSGVVEAITATPGAAAGAFRAVVPQAARDVLGAGLQQVAKNIERGAGAVGGALTVVPGEAETPLKAWSRLAQGWMEPGSVNWEHVGLVRLLPEGSELRRIASEFARVGFDPITWAAVGVTGPAALGRLGLGRIPVLGRLLEPLIAGGVGTRAVAETTFGAVAIIAAEEAAERGAPPVVALGAGMLAGLASLPAIRGAIRAAPAVGRAAVTGAEVVGREALEVARLADEPLTRLSGIGPVGGQPPTPQTRARPIDPDEAARAAGRELATPEELAAAAAREGTEAAVTPAQRVRVLEEQVTRDPVGRVEPASRGIVEEIGEVGRAVADDAGMSSGALDGAREVYVVRTGARGLQGRVAGAETRGIEDALRHQRAVTSARRRAAGFEPEAELVGMETDVLAARDRVAFVGAGGKDVEYSAFIRAERLANEVVPPAATAGPRFAEEAAEPPRARLDVPEPEPPRVQGELSVGADEVEPPPARATAEPPTEPPREPPPAPPTPEPGGVFRSPFERARDKLLDLLREERSIARVGIAKREITTGRVRQAGRLAGVAERAGQEAIAPGDLSREIRRAAAVGPLRERFAEPLALFPEEQAALTAEIVRLQAAGEITPFEMLRASITLDQLVEEGGRRLQPKQRVLLARVMGDEVVEALAKRPRTRIAAEKAEAKELRETQRLNERALDKQLKEAQRVEARANQIEWEEAELRDIKRAEDPRDIPVQAPGKLEKARVTSVNAFNRAEEQEIASVRRWNATQEDKQKRAQNRGVQQADERERAARERFENKRSELNDEQLVRRALGMLAEADPALARELGGGVANWLETNRIMLDMIGEDASLIVSVATAQLTGAVADSFVTAAMRRTALLGGVLRQMGFADDVVRKVVDDLLEAEMKTHYGGTIPDRVVALRKKAGGLSYDESWGGFDAVVQQFKNTMFGVDLGIFGVQGLAAITRGGGPMLAGMVNRTLTALNVPHAAVLNADIALARRLQFMLDGVSHYSAQGASSSPVRTQAGSALQWLGPPGKALDRMAWEPVAETLNRWQFGNVMGFLRDLNHEGNLVLLHLLGEDITSPLVRQQSARSANAIGSFANTALDTRRAGMERRLLTSPSMTRAQIEWVTQIAKALTPSASSAERKLAAMAIVSFAGSVLAVGKLMHDQFGMGDFEFDPSKPGFGRFQLRNGWNVGLFPQISITVAIAKSVRELAGGGAAEAAQVWAKYFLGRSSFVGRAAGALAGYGYQAGVGWRLGDLPKKDRILAVLPIPPVVQHIVSEGVAPFALALEELGISTFREGGLAQAQRVSKEESGTEYLELERDGKAAFDDAHPEIKQQMDVDSRERGGPFADVLDVYEETEQGQLVNDAALERGRRGEPDGIDISEWKRRRKGTLDRQAGALGLVFKDFGNREPDPDRPEELYWAKIREHTEGNVTDWDAVDEWRSGLDETDSDLIDSRTGLKATPAEKEYRATGRDLRKAEFFDLRDTAWTAFRELHGELESFGKDSTSPDDWWDRRNDEVRWLTNVKIGELDPDSPDFETQAAQAAIDATDEVARYRIVSEFNKFYRTEFRHAWVVGNKELAQQGEIWKYFSPDKVETEFLRGLREPH